MMHEEDNEFPDRLTPREAKAAKEIASDLVSTDAITDALRRVRDRAAAAAEAIAGLPSQAGQDRPSGHPASGLRITQSGFETTVEREIDTQLILPSNRSVCVPTLLSFRSHDPYAVHITFHAGSQHPVTWTFARELLSEGALRPIGKGDVRIWPGQSGGQGVVCIALSSPDGDALLEMPGGQLAPWLEQTLRVVPAGTEAQHLGMDDAWLEERIGGLPGSPGTRED